jgi:hypothetical protein
MLVLASGQLEESCVSTKLGSFCSQSIFGNPLFCGTYFGSQRGGFNVLFTTLFMDDLILVSDDDGNDGDDDDDDKDGEVELHVDVGGWSQFLDENIPSGDDAFDY